MTAHFKRKKTLPAEQLTFTTTIVKPIQSGFDQLPDSAFIREAQLVQSPKRPGGNAPLPFSAPTLWRKVKAGTFPKPTKLGPNISAWRVGPVREWMQAQAAV